MTKEKFTELMVKGKWPEYLAKQIWEDIHERFSVLTDEEQEWAIKHINNNMKKDLERRNQLAEMKTRLLNQDKTKLN